MSGQLHDGYNSARTTYRWERIRSLVLQKAEAIPGKVEEFKAHPIVEAFCRRDRPSETSDLTSLLGVQTAKHLAFAVCCREPRMDLCRSSPEGVDIWKGDYVDLFLDWRHSHREYLHVIANPGGRIETQVLSASLGNMAWDGRCKPIEVDVPGLDCHVENKGDTWWLVVHVPLESLPGRSSVVMGLMAARSRRADLDESTCLTPFPSGTTHRPTDFPDLYLVDRGVRVTMIDLDRPSLLDERPARLELENRAETERDITLTTTTWCSADAVKRPLPEKHLRKYRENTVRLTLPPESTQTVTCTYAFSPEDAYFMRVGFRLEEADGALLYEDTHDFGFEVAHMVTYLKHEDHPPVPAPDPDDPDFLVKKRLFLVHAFPPFERRTTAQGAASDFVIEAVDASVRFDLMQPDVLARMADYVRRRFDNDEDRLLGCAFLLHQPAFITYTLGRAQQVTSAMTPLSQLRFGSGQCGTFATACLGVVEQLASEDGERFEGTILNTPGHTMTAVRLYGACVVLDPGLGNLFYVEDNSRLATVEEILEKPELAGRSSPLAEHYFRDPDLVFFETHAGAAFPEHAPE